ncbi:MAG: hypothetical protein ACI4OZ_09280 [Akkermansia sp.]
MAGKTVDLILNGKETGRALTHAERGPLTHAQRGRTDVGAGDGSPGMPVPERKAGAVREMRRADFGKEKEEGTAAGGRAAAGGGAAGGGSGEDDYWARMRDSSAREKVDYLMQERKRTEEDGEELKRKERRLERERLFAAIGDGLSALSNMYFASRGARPMRTMGLSEGVSERGERIRRGLEESRNRGFSLLDAQNRIAADMAELRSSQERARRSEELAERKHAREDRKAEVYSLRQLAAVEKEGAMSDFYRRRADILERQADGLITKQQAEIELTDARRRLAVEQAAYYRRRPASGGSGATARYPVYDADGNLAGRVLSRDEAMAETAKLGGTYPTMSTERETERSLTGQRTRSVTKRVVAAGNGKGGQAAEPPGTVAKGGGSRGGGSKTGGTQAQKKGSGYGVNTKGLNW